MALYVAAVHLAGGTESRHIAEVIWMTETFQPGRCKTSEIVSYIEAGNPVRANGGKTVEQVGVVRQADRPAYIQTHAENQWTDVLLSLPRY
ncbi:MAG: DUF3892 domain-containing protein [Acidimicrobiales bacterium]